MISVFDRVETLLEKEKMLVTSIFSFSHNVFKRLLSWSRLQSGLCGKELIIFISYPDRRKERTRNLLHCFLYTVYIGKSTITLQENPEM